MSVSQHIPQAKLARALGRERGGAAALVVCWEISPSAIRFAPLPEIAAMNGQAEKIGRATLEWRIEGNLASAVLRLEIGEADLVVPLVADAPAIIARAHEWRHIRVDDRLVLSEHAGAVAYARTTLLSDTLALPGGVYDAPSAE